MLYVKEARAAGHGDARCDDRALTRQAAILERLWRRWKQMLEAQHAGI
jgi:hypothetical protein